MKKLKSQKGFTLVEMLACVVTLILLAGICGAGTNIAMKSYNESLFESNSQMLESTWNMYPGDIIRHASMELQADADPASSENRKIKSITNVSYGMYQGKFSLTDGRIYIHKTGADAGMRLLSEKVYAQALKISDFELEYNETGEYVAGSYTIESTIISDLKRNCNFKYKVVIDD